MTTRSGKGDPMQEPPIQQQTEVVIKKLQGRDCIQPVVIAHKVNELIDRFDELCAELAASQIIKKE